MSSRSRCVLLVCSVLITLAAIVLDEADEDKGGAALRPDHEQKPGTRLDVVAARVAALPHPSPDMFDKDSLALRIFSFNWHYVILMLSLVWMHAYVFLRDKPSLLVAGIYVLYIGLHTTASSMQVLVGKTSTDVMAMAQAVVFMSLVMKLAISIILLSGEICRDRETPRWQFALMFKECSLCTLVPSTFYTSSDLFLVYCQQSMTMTEVQILQKVGIPITALVWYLIFRVNIGIYKLLGLGVIMSGTVLYAYGGSATAAAHMEQHGGLNLWFYRSMLVLQVCFATCGGVSNEYFLLKCRASTNMQNCGMYMQGLLLICGTSFFFGTGIPVRHALKFTAMQWGCVVALAMTGICTSHFLRHLGSIWKQVAYGAMLVVFFAVDNFVFGKTYATLAVAGVLIVACGNCICVLDGVKETRLAPPDKKSLDAQEEKTNISSKPLSH